MKAITKAEFDARLVRFQRTAQWLRYLTWRLQVEREQGQ